MQVKRFVADDMRTAMRVVKEEIGADAVILSNRVVDGQVEILAARDYDENLMNNALNLTLAESKPDSAAAYYERAAAQRELQQQGIETTETYKKETKAKEKTSVKKDPQPDKKNIQNNKSYTQVDDPITENRHTEKTRPSVEPVNTVDSASTPSFDDAVQNYSQPVQQNAAFTNHQASGLYQPAEKEAFSESMLEMRDELKSLRAMIENQQILGEWHELASRHPIRASLYKRLTEMGLSQDVCKYLAKGLDSQEDIEQAMQAALNQLLHQIPVASDDMLNQGGVYAMVGPTGVGKTTTIAKLAARFAMQHGQRHVALVSTDTYRIGAHEQLMTYGRLLGIPVHVANDAKELQQLLHKLQDKKMVLIDTAGMSQRDIGLSQQFSQLGNPSSMIKPCLVLSANAQPETLDEVIGAFKKANPIACILTKLDESASIGSILSAVIKHHLPVVFTSNGQKVPEDLQPARARELVNMAIFHAKRHKRTVDDEFMAVAFNRGMSHASL